MELSTFFLIGILLAFIIYKLGTWNFDYFTSRGIKTVRPVPFFGSFANVVFKTRHFSYSLLDLCKHFKNESMVGMFQFTNPILVIKDPELIKKLTVKEFDHFTDHVKTGLEKTDTVFSKNLFTLKGEKWRSMRITLSPAFTSNKLKNMFSFIDKCGQQLADYITEGINKQEPGKPYVLEMKDLFTRFTNDVIATTAFGLHTDSLKEQQNEFYLTGKGLTSFSTWKSFTFMLGQFMPKLAEILGLSFLSNKEKNFFIDLIHETVSAREKHGIVRPDMIHLLMQARKGELKDEEDTLANGVERVKKAELSEDDIAAQAMIFFFAGFDTASTLLSFTSILLATNEDAQRKLQQEIDEVMADGKDITYEKVQSMQYLDMVISESLRIFPPVPMLDRQCTKTFTIPSYGNLPAYTLKKGDVINIPIYGIHHDPDYYPDPEKFDPERFSDENKQNIKPYTYLPFGVGPRLCIGQRLALLEAKLAIFHILSRFNLVVVDKTPSLPLTLHPDSFQMKVKGDFWMGATLRQRTST